LHIDLYEADKVEEDLSDFPGYFLTLLAVGPGRVSLSAPLIFHIAQNCKDNYQVTELCIKCLNATEQEQLVKRLRYDDDARILMLHSGFKGSFAFIVEGLVQYAKNDSNNARKNTRFSCLEGDFAMAPSLLHRFILFAAQNPHSTLSQDAFILVGQVIQESPYMDWPMKDVFAPCQTGCASSAICCVRGLDFVLNQLSQEKHRGWQALIWIRRFVCDGADEWTDLPEIPPLVEAASEVA
jgi:hypothetical protein